MLEPVDEVVYLIEIDVVAKKRQGALYLRFSLASCRGPYFGSYEGLITPPLQGLTQHLFGCTVHGGGIEEVCPDLKCHIHHSASIPLSALSSHIKGPPRPHPDYGYLQTTLPQIPPFHVPFLSSSHCSTFFSIMVYSKHLCVLSRVLSWFIRKSFL